MGEQFARTYYIHIKARTAFKGNHDIIIFLLITINIFKI